MERSQLYQHIINTIKQVDKKLIFLIGPRESGKTMILKRLREDSQLGLPCMYCNFENDLITQQFDTAQDIMYYLQLSYGIDFTKPHLILLNEIQYSRNSASLLLEIAQHPNHQVTIVATGTYLRQQNQLVTSLDAPTYTQIQIPPMSFLEFLEARGIHTEYVSLTTASKIIIQQLKPLRQEYCIRGGYPAVIFATSEEHKRIALKRIIQKIIDKDLSFRFSGDEYVKFNRFLQLLITLNGQRLKIIPIARTLGYTTRLVSAYIDFVHKNGLITLIYPRSQDRSKELSKSPLLYRSDTGMLHYLQDTLSQKIITTLTLKTVVMSELSKKPSTTLQYYQKTNGSLIDAIVHTPQHDYCVDISDQSTASCPKMFHHLPEPLSAYSHIKTAHIAAPFQQDTHLTIPHCLVSLLKK